ncbi:MAG: hypothetical protein KDD58_07030 [Bdellovibrionales bacterium]|nr:hypothetical protein [Bdellovibrionales bacterium]
MLKKTINKFILIQLLSLLPIKYAYSHAFDTIPLCTGSHREVANCLNNYAVEILSKTDLQGNLNPLQLDLDEELSLKGRSVFSSQLKKLNDFSIKIDLFNKECFNLSTKGSSRKLSRRKQNKFSNRDIRVILLTKQIRESAIFIKNYLKSTMGAKYGAFQIDSIQLCSQDGLDRVLTYNSGTLYLGIDPYDEDSILSAKTIKEMWNNREHFRNQSWSVRAMKHAGMHWMPSWISELLASKAVKEEVLAEKLWLIFNPIGTFRSEFRRSLSFTQDILTEKVVNKRSSLIKQLNHKIFSQSLKTKIKNLTQSELDYLFEKWIYNLMNPNLADNIYQSSLQLGFESIDIVVERHNEGFISVTNWHAILAGLDMLPTTSIHNPYLNQAIQKTQGTNDNKQKTLRIHHKQTSDLFLNVDTFDFVHAYLMNVKLQLSQNSNQLPVITLYQTLEEEGYINSDIEESISIN